MVIVLYAFTAFLYGSLALYAWLGRGARHEPVDPGRVPSAGGGGGAALAVGAEPDPMLMRVLLFLGLVSHGLLLHETVFQADAMIFGFAHALSVMLWLGVCIYWVESLFYPLLGLRQLILPVAWAASLLPLAFDETHVVIHAASPLFKLHFIIANMAYGLLAIAAFHAVLMQMVERRLHQLKRPRETDPYHWRARWLDTLPPLLTLESLLFRLITAGFLLLTLTVFSGVWFSEALFGRAFQWDHKTVFALLSWLMFAGILLGRWCWGWRGRTALRWVIASFVILLLAYVGSRFVLEVLLHRV